MNEFSCHVQLNKKKKKKKGELNLQYNYTVKGLLVKNNENKLNLNNRKTVLFVKVTFVVCTTNTDKTKMDNNFVSVFDPATPELESLRKQGPMNVSQRETQEIEIVNGCSFIYLMCVFSHQLSQLLLILYSIRTYFSNLNLKPSLLFGFLKISSSGSK